MASTVTSEYAPILDTGIAAAIGEFIASWSGTTGLLTMLLSDLAAGKSLGPTDDVTGSMALVGMDIRVQLGLLKTLGVARLGKKNEKAITAIVEKLEKSKKQRDVVAHAVWSIDAKGRTVAHTLKTVGTLKYQKRQISKRLLNQEIQSLVHTTNELVGLFQKQGFLSGLEHWNGRFF